MTFKAELLSSKHYYTDIFYMGKKTSKKSKKNRKNKNIWIIIQEKVKSLNKKTIITIISVFCAILLITGTVLCVRTVLKRRADRTVRVAFYGLSEEMMDLIKEKIPQEENIILQYEVIAPEAFDTEAAKKKYDMLFTWRGEVTDSLSPSAQDIPARILETMPNSLRNKKCLPIILDHCELTFSQEVLNKTSSNIPMSFTALNEFLNTAKGVVFSPFFCNGAEDRILIDFIGAVVMAEGGLSAYNKLIEELRMAESLDAVINIKLDGKDCTLRSILDMLKAWPKEGLTHPAWYNGRGNDLVYFAEAKQLACFFTLLSEHRKISYNVVKNYDASLFPPDVNASNYGIIAPAVSVMLLSDNSNSKRYISAFFTEETQEEFSNKTTLAPVHYRAQAYDRQADDVRFWAASCKGGAMPDLYLAVYQRKPEDLKKMCGEIRNYVR